ncbi:MAG: DUF2914 domain-containing protein [Myxococcales bacterium]|nr:DUF2914 domain-containing protein [Myxococcales bacterium]
MRTETEKAARQPEPPRAPAAHQAREARDAASPDAVATAPAPPSLVHRFLRRVLPWVSLGVGVLGALMMDRGPERAVLVAAATVVVWLTLMVLQWLGRSDRAEERGLRGGLVKVARASSLMATQSLIQLTLFFALPFYFQAATLDLGHAIFLIGLIVLSAASLWDPLTEWLLRRPLLAPILPLSGTFAALTAVLPGFGLSTRLSLWLAAIAAALGMPLMAAAAASRGRRRRTMLLAVLASSLLPLSLYLGATRLVPAAPLTLVRVEIGTERSGKWVAQNIREFYGTPERLICATAIASPLGLKDRLFHVWRKDGELRARIELEIVGGRKQGYRTQSRLTRFSGNATGLYSCTVETLTGQVLGTRHVRVSPEPG